MGLYRPLEASGERSPYWHYDFMVRGRRYKRSTGKVKKDEAREIERERRDLAKSGRETQEIRPATFSALADEYVKLHAESETKSAKNYGSQLVSIRNYFGDRPLAGISRRDCEEFMAARRKDVKASSANATLTMLKQVFNWAVDHDYLPEGASPARRLKLTRVEPRDSYLDVEQTETLLDACADWLKPMVLTALHTGARRGELLGLTWQDVDFGAQVVNLRRTKGAVPRRVPMSEDLTAVLKALPGRLKSPAVFLCDGQPVTQADLRRGFGAARKKAGFGWLHFHDLRHTWATHAGSKGMHPRTLQVYGGWKQLSMVMRYCAVAKESEAHARGLLNRIFEPSPTTFPPQVNVSR